MQYADKEQDARINFNFERLNLTKGEQKIIKTSLWLAFMLVCVKWGRSLWWKVGNSHVKVLPRTDLD
jgi:hypothetical protein